MILLIPLNAAIAVRTRAYQVYIAPSAALRAYRWGQGVEVVVMMIVIKDDKVSSKISWLFNLRVKVETCAQLFTTEMLRVQQQSPV